MLPYSLSSLLIHFSTIFLRFFLHSPHLIVFFSWTLWFYHWNIFSDLNFHQFAWGIFDTYIKFTDKCLCFIISFLGTFCVWYRKLCNFWWKTVKKRKKLKTSDWMFVHVESSHLQMRISFPFLRGKDLRKYLLIIRTRSFLLSCT